MLKLVDLGSLKPDKFQGTEGIGRAPGNLDWITLSRLKDVDHYRGAETGQSFVGNRSVPKAGSTRAMGDDALVNSSHTQRMNDITREELSSTLSAIEERMDKRIDRMERSEERRSDDFRKELALRDTQLQRELDIRQESFRAEQITRDAALSEKFAGFLAAQAERDKAWEKISESRFERIEKDIGSIKADTKKMGEDVNGIKVTMGKYLGGAIVIGAIASALLGVALKYVFTLSS